MSTVAQATNGSRCRGRNRAGLPCARRAVKDGYCTTHHPTEGQDMRELGRKGGKVRPLTRLRERADDDLRELARETLAKALRGEQVEKAQLDAARSLFSYRADSPPQRDASNGEYRGPLTADRRRPTSLEDVLRFAVSISEGALMPPDLVEACRQVVEAAEGAPSRVLQESRSS